MLILHQSDTGSTVSVDVGTKFHIELEENRTTGYAWSAPEFDRTGLTLESDDVVPAAGPKVGGAGLRRFVFLAKAAGRGPIRTALHRSWESAASATARFEVTLVRS